MKLRPSTFVMNMVMAQTRCKTAHSPSRCLFLSDSGNSNIVSLDFRVTIAGKNLEHAQNTRSDPLSSTCRFSGHLDRISLNLIASNPIRFYFLSDWGVYMNWITQSYCNLAINPIRWPACNRTDRLHLIVAKKTPFWCCCFSPFINWGNKDGKALY